MAVVALERAALVCSKAEEGDARIVVKAQVMPRA